MQDQKKKKFSTLIETEGLFPCSQKFVIKSQRVSCLYKASHLNSYSCITVPPTPTYPRCCFTLRFTDWSYIFFSHTNTNVYLHTFLTLLILHLWMFYCIRKIPSFSLRQWPTWYTNTLFYNTFIINLYMFRALYAHHQEVELYWCSIWYRHSQ